MKKLLVTFLTACLFLFSGSLMAGSGVLKEALVRGSPWTGTWESNHRDGGTTIEFSMDSKGHLSGNITKDTGGHSFSPVGPLRDIALEGENRITFLSNAGSQYQLTLKGGSLSGEIDGGNWTASMVLKPGSGRVR